MTFVGVAPRPRIALIAPPWLPVPPPSYGGTESVIDRLARGFAAAGHEVLLFTTGDSTCAVPRAWALEASDPVHLGNGVIEIRHLIEAYEAVRDFDIVHDHTMLGPIYAQRFPDLPVVTTMHGDFNPETLPLYRRVAEQVPLVAISHDQAARSVDIPVATVIHHGVDVDCFPVGTGGNESLAFLGRMTPEKGVREAALVALEVGLPLRIAAKCREPAEVEYFEHEVRPLLGSGIEYLGEIGPADRAELLAESLALVNPIKWAEPFGLVMAEALACGTPVLASRCGAAPEIVDHGVTGFLCNDRTDMVAKIERLGEISRDACRTAAVTRFSTERMVRDYLDFFAVVLAGHGHQRSIAATGIAS